MRYPERGGPAGDKTMVDALNPRWPHGTDLGPGLLPMLQAAEKAAAQGVEDKTVSSQIRAANLMERSGLPGCGATSI
ncbi:hypothetical protein [Enterocloster sp.]|uniref:hypothetical protein n=1 Tax=Enterocloster sp. TaxID=2719315 RepID=UPI0039A13759